MTAMEIKRRDNKMSQEEMAKVLDVSIPTYVKYENDTDLVPVGKAKAFCIATGANFDLIFLSDEAKNNSTED